MDFNLMNDIKTEDLDIGKFKMERINKCLSTYDLAYATGLDRNTVSKFEKGGNLREENIFRMFNALKLDIKDYFKKGNCTKVMRYEDIDIDKIVKERKRQGITKIGLSKETGINRETIYCFENGKKIMRMHNIARITDYLGYRIEHFEKV